MMSEKIYIPPFTGKTRSYILPTPTENTRNCSHLRISTAVSIMPGVISISISMPIFIRVRMSVLFSTAKVILLECCDLCIPGYTCSRDLLRPHFQTLPCINRKECHEIFNIQFPKQRCAWHTMGYGSKYRRVKTLMGQNTEKSKHRNHDHTVCKRRQILT